jgi:hypothetical protein
MKSIFNKSEQDEIRQRLEKLRPNTPALWGKMNATEMLVHCTGATLMPMGDLPVKNVPFLIRWLIGKRVKKFVLREGPLRKNSPTAAELKNFTDIRDFEAEKQRFLAALNKIGTGRSAIKRELHPFFGSMTPEEWGELNYKHTDHHFSQFGV